MVVEDAPDVVLDFPTDGKVAKAGGFVGAFKPCVAMKPVIAACGSG
jgi:hypothetical protein